MKKLLLFTFSALLAGNIVAQPWMNNRKGPQKLDDIIAAHQKEMAAEGDDEGEEEYGKDGKAVKEAKDHLFQKWVWYWRQHLDKDGYIVPTMKTWEEWEKYRSKNPQAQAKATANQSQWTFEGPKNSNSGYSGIGRINVIAFHPTDTNTFWIGSAGGGAWRTVDNGMSWEPMYHDLIALGASDIDYNPLNPNTIYLCTGDRDGGDTYSLGVMKSTDGGASWQSTGLSFNLYDYFLANTLVINPQDTSTLLLASSYGIYRSTDAGASWTNVLGGGFKEIKYCPTDTNVVFATSDQVYRSADGGQTWQQVSFSPSSNRATVAVSPDNPAIVKAIFSDANSNGLEGVYSSTDTGKTFTKIYAVPDCSKNLLSWAHVPDSNSCGGQGWYDLCIALDPANANNVIIGGINTWYSTDGGLNWQIVTQWYDDLAGVKTAHADKHYLVYHPLTGRIFEGCDGGVYATSNPASILWNDLTQGLGITEFYRNATADVDSFVLGGSQDNGTKRVRTGLNSEDLTGGDGMECQADYVDSNIFYTAYQLGTINRTLDGGQNYTDISSNIPGQPSGSWVTPYCLDPIVHTSLYAGYKELFYSTDTGNSWTSISPVFQSGYFIDRIAVSHQNPNYIYLLDSNTIFYTSNHGSNWNPVYFPYPGGISDILVDPLDATHLWLTVSGYDTVHVAEYWPSQGGWGNYSQGLPNVPTSCILIDTQSRTKYIGTDVGVFYRDTTMSNWALFNNNNSMPSVHVTDLAINYSTYEIWAATYGRSMWRSPKNDQPPLPTGISIVPLVQGVLSVSPNPNNGNFTVHTGRESYWNKQASGRLVDDAGRTVWQGNVSFDESGHMNVHAGNQRKGRYIFEVVGKNILARVNVVIY